MIPNEPLKMSDGTQTMANLIGSVLVDPRFSDVRRRNLASSIRRFCAVLGFAPEEALATFWYFRDAMRRFAPAQAGLKPHRWETIKSDVTAALKTLGQSPDQAKPRVGLSEDWEEFRRRLSEAGQHWAMARLARFANER